MAERIMKNMLKKISLKDITVFSKGLDARGENITENAKRVLKQLGASSLNRKSVKLGKIDKSTLYVTMTEKQKERLNCANSISFKSLLGYEIDDPYGQSEDVYFETAKQIEKGIEVLIEKIKKWRKV